MYLTSQVSCISQVRYHISHRSGIRYLTSQVSGISQVRYHISHKSGIIYLTSWVSVIWVAFPYLLRICVSVFLRIRVSVFLRIRDSVILRICLSAIFSFAYPQFFKFFSLRPAEKLNPPIKPLPYSPNHPYINYLFFYKRRYTFIHICMEKIKLSAKKSFSLADPQNSHLHIRNILICISAIFSFAYPQFCNFLVGLYAIVKVGFQVSDM